MNMKNESMMDFFSHSLHEELKVLWWKKTPKELKRASSFNREFREKQAENDCPKFRAVIRFF